MHKHEFNGDKLNREQLAHKFVDIINGLDNNFTIALDAPWGSGKTKVIDFMCEKLDETSEIYLRYNAWDNDYTDSPLLSLMNSIFTSLNQKGITQNQFSKLKEHTYNASSFIGRNLLKGGARFLVGSEAVENLSDGLEEFSKVFINESAQVISDKAFSTLQKSKKSREDFTKELKSSISKILQQHDKKKVIVIIDELDRCKPTFAIELLENIKHLFNIKEIVFFIATDKTQLSESIKSVYGNNFDAKTYLHRFFDFDIYLPIPTHTTDYTFGLLQKIGVEGIDEFIYRAFTQLNLTLRDIEKIVSQVQLFKILYPQRYNARVLFILLILKYKISEIYYILSSLKEHHFKYILDNISDYKLKKFIQESDMELIGQSGSAIDYNREFLTSDIQNTMRLIDQNNFI